MKFLAYFALFVSVIVFGVVFYNKFLSDGLLMALFSSFIASGVPAIFTFVFFQISQSSDSSSRELEE